MFLVCDDTCREVVMDPTNELLVCTISGHCFDRLLSPSEMEPDAVSLQHDSNFAYPFSLLAAIILAEFNLFIKVNYSLAFVPDGLSFF